MLYSRMSTSFLKTSFTGDLAKSVLVFDDVLGLRSVISDLGGIDTSSKLRTLLLLFFIFLICCP